LSARGASCSQPWQWQTNALVIQQELVSSAPCDRHEGGLVDELRSLIRSNFVHFECSFKSRVCNEAAHALADLAYACIEGEEIVSNSIPSTVNVIVNADFSANQE
jgi:hypothetical protein